MTHFSVGIIIPGDQLPNLFDYIESRMAPFDESLEVDTYVCYSTEQAEADLDREIKRFESIIERNDPQFHIEKCQKHLETLRVTSPEERYREYTRFHDRCNREGEPVSRYNPKSKWDWYVIGGRWNGWIFDREAKGESVADNMTTTEDALARQKLPHAIITPDGQWHEHGKMGWWGIMTTENEHWETDGKSLLSHYPGHHIIILDAHI